MLMKPDLYNQLITVRGFTGINGKTYMEHITIILAKYLNNIQKLHILDCKNTNDALNLLKKNSILIIHTSLYIKFTHCKC